MLRLYNDRPAFEASIARRLRVILRSYAIDESHVETGGCPCADRIELRTNHSDLPESRRTKNDLLPNRAQPYQISTDFTLRIFDGTQ